MLVALIRDFRREVRSSAGRHVDLRWDLLGELLGEDLLVRLVTELPDLGDAADEDVVSLVAQARAFAADPEAAANAMAEQREQYPSG